MAKKTAKGRRHSAPLPDPDDFYFDDELDVVTRGLPTEAEYAAAEDESAAPAEKPLTEGIGRMGIRMVGLPPEPDTLDDESVLEESAADVPYDEDAEEETETVFASSYSAMPDEDEAADDFLTPRERMRREPRNAAAQPMRRPGRYHHNEDDDEEKKNRRMLLRRIFLTIVTVVLGRCGHGGRLSHHERQPAAGNPQEGSLRHHGPGAELLLQPV